MAGRRLRPRPGDLSRNSSLIMGDLVSPGAACRLRPTMMETEFLGSTKSRPEIPGSSPRLCVPQGEAQGRDVSSPQPWPGESPMEDEMSWKQPFPHR